MQGLQQAGEMVWQKFWAKENTESNFLHQCPAGKQLCRKDFPGVPSVPLGEHELATCPCNKGGLVASWAGLGMVLPAGWGRWSFFTKHRWDTSGVLASALDSTKETLIYWSESGKGSSGCWKNCSLRTVRKGWELGLLSLGKDWGLGDLINVCKCWIGGSKEDWTKLSLCIWWCGKREGAETEEQEVTFKCKKNLFFFFFTLWSSTEASCPERLWSSRPLRYSKLNWCGPEWPGLGNSAWAAGMD